VTFIRNYTYLDSQRNGLADHRGRPLLDAAPRHGLQLPASTQTLPGEEIERPPVTVTQPGHHDDHRRREVDGGHRHRPAQARRGWRPRSQRAVVNVTAPSHTIHLKSHIVHGLAKVVAGAKEMIVKVIRIECGVRGTG
jgi:hypothetical protein